TFGATLFLKTDRKTVWRKYASRNRAVFRPAAAPLFLWLRSAVLQCFAVRGGVKVTTSLEERQHLDGKRLVISVPALTAMLQKGSCQQPISQVQSLLGGLI